VAVVQYTFTQK